MSEFDPSTPPAGLGDTIAAVTHKLGIDKVADTAAKLLGKKDCGCKKRAETLNRLFPYVRQDGQVGPPAERLEIDTSQPPAQDQDLQELPLPGLPGLPPSPVKVLAALANDPETLEKVFTWCKQVHPEFPEMGATLVTARLAFLAGAAIPYAPLPAQQVGAIQALGAKQIPATDPPRPGDFYVSAKDGEVERIGIVAGLADLGHFLAVDNLCADFQPYRRNIAAGDFPPVLCWLRFGGG